MTVGTDGGREVAAFTDGVGLDTGPATAAAVASPAAAAKSSGAGRDLCAASTATISTQLDDTVRGCDSCRSGGSLAASLDQAKESLQDLTRAPPPQSSRAGPACGGEVPDSWRSLLEDLMRRAQWATEDVRRELLVQLQREAGDIRTRHDALREEVLQKVGGAATTADDALRQSEEALSAARLSAELIQEAEEASMRKVGKVEAGLRAGMDALAAEVSRSASRSGLEGSLREIEARSLSMEGSFRTLECRCSELSESLHLAVADLEVQKCAVREFEPFRASVGRRLEELQSGAARPSGAVAGQGEARTFSEGELRDVAAAEARAAVAERCRDLNGLVEQLRTAALEEARAALAEKCGELRELNERLCSAALEQARCAVAEKCGELRGFAERLRDVVLEEVRGGLAMAAPPCPPRTPRELPKCGVSGSGVGAARALRSGSPAPGSASSQLAP